MIWFTSDTHFGHTNIIRLCDRPFKSIYHMDKKLIENWNARVGKDDTVIFLGDFCYHNALSSNNYITRLNGKITFLEGNHDPPELRGIQNLVIHFEEQDIYCTHRPEDFSSAYSLNLVGHVHEKWLVKKIYNTYLVNVSVDVWKFAPVTIEEILAAKAKYEKEWKVKWLKRYGKRYDERRAY